MPKPPPTPNGYPALRQQVAAALLEGQRRIEEAKVQTYWRAGKLISAHILSHGSRSEHYGQEVIEKLSRDLKISDSVLWRCVRFVRSFKNILAARPESLPALTWTHYRTLITVPDEESRRDFMLRAEKSGWSTDELIRKIREEFRPALPRAGAGLVPAAGGAVSASAPVPAPLPAAKLIPRKGKLYTYRLIAPDSVHEGDEGPWIDLGFQVHRRLPAGPGARNLKEGQIIETIKSQSHKVTESQDYAVTASKAGEKDLFTYQAFIERVIDGDTLLVKIDLGFSTRVRKYLQLRGIDAPEIATPQGKR